MPSDTIPVCSTNLPSPPAGRDSLFTVASRSDGRLSDVSGDHAGAYGDKSPIGIRWRNNHYVMWLTGGTDLFRDIAKHLEHLSITLSKNDSALTGNHQELDELAFLDREHTRGAERLQLSFANAHLAYKTENEELKRAFDKGFRDLGVALDGMLFRRAPVTRY